MKKTLLRPALLLLSATTLFAACKKDKTASRHDMMVGKWATKTIGTDVNENGSWDATEHNDYAASVGGGTSTFSLNTDGTGSSHSVDLSNGQTAVNDFNFTWALAGDDKYIVLTVNGTSLTGAVEGVSSTDMTIRADSSNSQNGHYIKSWSYYQKVQ